MSYQEGVFLLTDGVLSALPSVRITFDRAECIIQNRLICDLFPAETYLPFNSGKLYNIKNLVREI